MHLYKVYGNGSPDYYVWATDSLAAKIALRGHVNDVKDDDIVRIYEAKYQPPMVLVREP